MWKTRKTYHYKAFTFVNVREGPRWNAIYSAALGTKWFWVFLRHVELSNSVKVSHATVSSSRD